MSLPEYPEIEFALDEDGNAYLVQVKGELLLDINHLQTSTINDFHDTFEAGIKAGLMIAQMRAETGTGVSDDFPSPEDKEAEVDAAFTEETAVLVSEIKDKLRKSREVGVIFDLRGGFRSTRWSDEAIQKAIVILKTKGWKAKRHTGSEERDPSGWDDLHVEKA